jgi:hypothetical protein
MGGKGRPCRPLPPNEPSLPLHSARGWDVRHMQGEG